MVRNINKDDIKNFILLVLQRLWLTLELFNKNGLMNHAAACAYGFLLSSAPALLFIAFIISRILSVSPDALEYMLEHVDMMLGVFNFKNHIINFLSYSSSGIAGVVSVLIIFWTTRLCALSIQRGLGVVFSGTRSILKNNAITIGLGLLAMFIILIALIGTRAVIILFNSFEFLSIIAIAPFINISARLFFIFSLALIAAAAYRFYPSKKQRLKYIAVGVIACIALYLVFAAGFAVIIGPERYNLIYGALGRLFLFLINIYFFFVFFFFGGQLINVLSFSDEMLFIRLRQVYLKGYQPKNYFDKLFATLTKPLKKYHKIYKKGEPVFKINSRCMEVYYILSGKAGVYIDSEFNKRISYVDEYNFFGEMASITSDERAASIKAETDLSVLVLPPAVFRVILQLDPNIDQSLIKILSEQLKSANQQFLSDN